MVPRLALLFIIVPILELAILVQLGQSVGFWPTLALVLLTGFVGAALTRSAGMKLLTTIRSELSSGRMPSQSLMDGVAILAGGALLLTPGLITDLLAFSLLFTPTRRWIQARARKWLEQQVVAGRVQVGVVGTEGLVFGKRVGGAGADRPSSPGRDPRTGGRLDPRNEIEQPPPD
jgi:UPF0716 protein FxsA